LTLIFFEKNHNNITLYPKWQANENDASVHYRKKKQIQHWNVQRTNVNT